MLKGIARGAISRAARTTNTIVPPKARRFIAESWEAGSQPAEVRFACPVCQGATPYFKPMPADASAVAHELFAVLRDLDAAGVTAIWVEEPPPGPEWDGVRDRLRRAAA